MINNVARAVKRLASMGISKFVVVADHGHLFISERDESERIEKPGGDQSLSIADVGQGEVEPRRRQHSSQRRAARLTIPTLTSYSHEQLGIQVRVIFLTTTVA